MHKEMYYLAYNAFWIIIAINMICENNILKVVKPIQLKKGEIHGTVMTDELLTQNAMLT